MIKKKIITRLCGGIGNQLFIYAASRRLAYINNAELVLDIVSGFKHDYKYRRNFQLSHFNIKSRNARPSEIFHPFTRYVLRIKSWLNRPVQYSNKNYIKEYNLDFDNRLLDFRVHSNLYLEGYWQSYKYFEDIEGVIRSDLEIIPPNDSVNLSTAKKITNSKSVAIHIRYFDNSLNNSSNNAPVEYYIDAIRRMEIEEPNSHYFIFSDKPINGAIKLYLPKNRFTIINHNFTPDMAYADLWLMSLCNNFIASNSTFCWWACWLSKNTKKIVFCPSQNRFDKEHSWALSNLIPDDWVQL